MDARLLMLIGFALVMVGMLIITLSLARSAGSGRSRSTGFILLGPIPIVWHGSRPLLFIVPAVLLVAVILLLIMVSMR
ncbi:MAG: DUF131 domain-containing protein [Candidatus Nitrosocaldus sp.]|nr:DUF131 domain-containing protein [Candidatus Nitrosocaldus sp.]MDW8276077.1 DUF131 domain-containing protein [Candidatus Nitrosocaldus sp.]